VSLVGGHFEHGLTASRHLEALAGASPAHAGRLGTIPTMDRRLNSEEGGSAAYRRGAGQTRISAKHQVTIPLSAFVDAGFRAGDAVSAEAIGPGRVVLTRQDALLDKFSGSLSTRGGLRRTVERLRHEWGVALLDSNAVIGFLDADDLLHQGPQMLH